MAQAKSKNRTPNPTPAKAKGRQRYPLTVRPATIPHDGLCGAKVRAGGACGQRAGWGTNHPGQGRCKLHGGATPIRHGRYSTVTNDRIRELIEQHALEPDPLNTLREIAFVRALLQDYVERYQENNAAILAWYLSWSTSQRPIDEEKVMAFERIVDDFEEQLRTRRVDLTERQEEALGQARAFLTALRNANTERPRQLLDISSAYQMAGEVSKMVERIERTRAANAVSRGDLLRILSEMGRTVQLHVTDEATRDRIKAGWQEIRL